MASKHFIFLLVCFWGPTPNNAQGLLTPGSLLLHSEITPDGVQGLYEMPRIEPGST